MSMKYENSNRLEQEAWSSPLPFTDLEKDTAQVLQRTQLVVTETAKEGIIFWRISCMQNYADGRDTAAPPISHTTGWGPHQYVIGDILLSTQSRGNWAWVTPVNLRLN